MNTEHMIEVTSANPIDLVKAAYDLSSPQGLGKFHFRPEPLSDEDAQAILDREKRLSRNRIVASMDYVHGRSCKFTIFQDEDGRRWIRDSWYDHSHEQLRELLSRCGIHS